MEVYNRIAEQNPVYRVNLAAIETITAARFSSKKKEIQEVTIPVVVHVIHRTKEQDIDDAQIASQIDVLNADFNRDNADLDKVPEVWSELVGNPKISFTLASKDPEGNASDGIVRVKTTKTRFSTDNGMKFAAKGGSDAWPADRYLNIWVCNIPDVLGYAQFPGGPAETDGVVITYHAFGTSGAAKAPFNKGRTTTHEVGHWLNLRHIWGDTEDCSGTDHVPDTPTQQLPNYGTPEFPHVSCSNGPDGDMFMNYMDYVDDAAMFMFTTGQVERMRAALEGPRRSLFEDEKQLIVRA